MPKFEFLKFKKETSFMKGRYILVVALALCPCLTFGQKVVIGSNKTEVIQKAEVVAATAAIPKFTHEMEVMDEPQYECIYSYKINAEVQESYSTILQIGKKLSKFEDYTLYALDSISFDTAAYEEEKFAVQKRHQSAMFCFDATVYQGLPNDEMTIEQDVVPSVMSYQETLGAMEWNLEDGEENICGYLCNKASVSYGGRIWTVWYAPEIPSSSGPWKFNGLPGLVMAASDSEGLHKFRAITFRNGTCPIAKKKDVTIYKSTRDKVLKAKVEAEKGGLKGINPASIKEIAVTYGTKGQNIFVNGVAIRERPNGYQALELE